MTLAQDELLIYPQPGQDHVRLAYFFRGPVRIKVSVFNVAGERVLQTEDPPFTFGETAYTDLETRQLGMGIYFVHLRVEDAAGRRDYQKRMAITH